MNHIAQAQELKTSDEINEEQIKLVKKQGDAFQEALKNMTQDEAQGQQMVAGDYIIAWANEKAEGMYVMQNGNLMWEEPKTQNTHLEITVCNAADGRFLPGLLVFVTLIEKNGNIVGTHQQSFLWHPWLFHYGRNWKVPNEGPYTLRIRVEAPDFPRHDKVNGKRFEQPVEVEFKNIKLELGKK